MTIEEIVLELVNVQSDTGTELERNIAEKIYEMIREQPYFSSHPEYCGIHEKNDILNRPVVWGLRKGDSNRTVILMGHYDAVEIETYGYLKPYALKPEELKKEMKKQDWNDKNLSCDLEDSNWMFGRGVGDMKSGLAINLHTLLNNKNEGVNILFVAVPDEENMSSGALQSVDLYYKLKEKFELDYKLCIISEPQFRNKDEDYKISEGSLGKFLSVIVTKGVLTHSSQILKGLNSAFILSEIINNLELNTNYISEDRGEFSQPPVLLNFKDLKINYDVSVPEYSVGLFSFVFLKSKKPSSIIKDLKNVAYKSLNKVIEKYNSTFTEMREIGFIKEKERRKFDCKVMTLSQLENYLRKKNKENFFSLKEKLEEEIEIKVKDKEMNLQDASSYYIKSLLDFSGIKQPLVVIGVAPPYYPAVTTRDIPKNIDKYFAGLNEFAKEKFDLEIKRAPYVSVMCDLSYFSSTNPAEERAFLNNITLPGSLYDVPVEKIAGLNIPAILLGPTCKDPHKIGERVYMPDVTERIPAFFEKIIDNI